MKTPHLTIRMTLLIIVSVLNLLIAVLVGYRVYKSWVYYQQVQSLELRMGVINTLYEASKNLSLARASTLSLMYSQPEDAEPLRKDLLSIRKTVDATLNLAFVRMTNKNILDVSTDSAQMKDKYQRLLKVRENIDGALSIPLAQRDPLIVRQFFEANTALIKEIQNFILVYSRSYQMVDAMINRHIMFEYFVWELAEYSGEEYAIIGQMIVENKYPTQSQRQQLISLRGHIDYGWEILHKFSLNNELAENLLPLMEEARTQYFFTFDQISDFFYVDHPLTTDISYPINSELWLGISAQAVDSLLTLQDKVLAETQNRIDRIENKAAAEIVISVFIFISAVLLSLYCGRIIIFRIARPVDAMVNALYRATQEGVFEMPKIHYQHDEIGKLARVLEVFQHNAYQMKQSNEELERFAFIAAHDLKSPLRAVDNISQWLEEDLEGLLPESSKKHFGELRKRIQLMDKLLDDTLEYARIDAKLASQASEIVNGKAMIEEIITLLNPSARFTIDVGFYFSRVNIQKFPLQQVLYNLINNAIKHHDKESALIKVDIEENELEYIFSIGDNGPGIDPLYHQKIFEMFQTLQPKDKSKGRGMGLAMVRKIVTAHGGEILVESALGKGTKFCFNWPKLRSNLTGDANVNIWRGYARGS